MGVTGGSGGVSGRGKQGEVGESERGVAVAGGGGWQGGELKKGGGPYPYRIRILIF